MIAWIREFLAAPVFEDDEDKTRAASLLNTILLGSLTVAVGAGIAVPIVFPAPAVNLVTLGMAILLVLGALFLTRRGHVQFTSVLFSSTLWMFDTLLIYISGGMSSFVLINYALVIVMVGLLLGGRAAIAFVGLCIVAGLGMIYAESYGLLPPPLLTFTPTAGWLVLAANLVMAAGLLHLAARSINAALEETRRSAAELEKQRERLEEMVEERTRDLVRRTRYMETTARVARDTASVLDLQELLSQVVTLVSEQFGFYHAGIFLLDPAGEWALLQAASSEGGQRMLARGHQLRVGQEGLVGYVTSRGQPRVALDVGADAVFFDNPDLPDTRSEMVLPLQARGEIIGALDVQSRESGAFSEEDVAVLQALADQVAVAISNARLFQQSQEGLEAVQRAHGEYTRQAWTQMLRTRLGLGYRYSGGEVVPVGDAAGETGLLDVELPALTLPVKYGDQVLGTIEAHKRVGADEWTPEEIALMETLTDQLSVALESAHLYEDSLRRAIRDRLVSEGMARVRETLDMDAVLKTAVQEIRQVLGVPEVVIRLAARPVSQDRERVE